ncbi:MAG: SPASM domain-containing protein [Nitrospirae bacterium]|nr:SPASM domain-containing protein [Nitrospirota bacterium]
MSSLARKTLLKRNAGRIEKCAACDITEYCNGGCMHHALAHHGTLDAPDHLCTVYKGLVKHAIKRIGQTLGKNTITKKEEMSKWKT